VLELGGGKLLVGFAQRITARRSPQSDTNY
jgi:hypothetical protein